MTSLRSSLKTTVRGFVLGILALGFAGAAAAWTAAPSTPPGSNVSAPINTSATAQTKAGQLTVGSFRVSGLSGTGTRCVQVSVSGTFSTTDEACGTGSGSGDITSVGAGSGLNGGGSSGAVSLAVDSTVVRTSGNQNMSGTKNFTGNLCIDSKCRSSWQPGGSQSWSTLSANRNHCNSAAQFVAAVDIRFGSGDGKARALCGNWQ